MILGDSLAVGLGQIHQECITTAKVGITSTVYIKKHPDNFVTDTAVISLGSNDWATIPTEKNIRLLRSHILAKKVYWIIPNINDWVRVDVFKVATSFGDATIDARTVPRSPDGIHPTYKGYKIIASKIK